MRPDARVGALFLVAHGKEVVDLHVAVLRPRSCLGASVKECGGERLLQARAVVQVTVSLSRLWLVAQVLARVSLPAILV